MIKRIFDLHPQKARSVKKAAFEQGGFDGDVGSGGGFEFVHLMHPVAQVKARIPRQIQNPLDQGAQMVAFDLFVNNHEVNIRIGRGLFAPKAAQRHKSDRQAADRGQIVAEAFAQHIAVKLDNKLFLRSGVMNQKTLGAHPQERVA